MSFGPYFGEKRQNINLSYYADSIIEEDMRRYSATSKSGFINTILENYCPKARATISVTISKERAKLQKAFGNNPSTNELIEKYLNNLAEEILNETREHKSGKQFKALINNRNSFYLTGEPENMKAQGIPVCDEDKYYKSANGSDRKDKYIKAVLEEYAKLSEKEREEIICDKTILSINQAIKNNNKIEVITSGMKFIVAPYKIDSDIEQKYNYLVGLSKNKENQNEDVKIYPFRISRITNIRETVDKYIFSDEQKKDIENTIIKKGIQFIGNDFANIKIVLTPKGQKMYEQIVHQRPFAINNPTKDADNPVEYIFDCSELQAEFYFLKFGAEAIVMEPQSLREKFKEHHRKAFSAYND